MFWSCKLTGILTILSVLSGYSLEEIEIETIKQKLRGTADESDLKTKKKGKAAESDVNSILSKAAFHKFI